MSIEEIKTAVDAGKTVHWANIAYKVVNGGTAGYLIKNVFNSHCIGLTNVSGDKLNGKPSEFFLGK